MPIITINLVYVQLLYKFTDFYDLFNQSHKVHSCECPQDGHTHTLGESNLKNQEHVFGLKYKMKKNNYSCEYSSLCQKYSDYLSMLVC